MLLSARSGLLPNIGARAAYTWTGATWALSGGRAFNTPTLGAEMLTDGGLETWLNASNLTNWTSFLAGSSTLNQESSIVQNGTYALRIDVDGSNSGSAVFQAKTTVVGSWYLVDSWMRSSASGKTMLLNFAGSGVARDPGTTWTQYYQVFRATATTHNYTLGRSSAASASLYHDNASLKAITLSTAISTVVGLAGQTVTAKPYAITSGTQAGVISHLDSAASPANFIIAYHDGGTSIRMDKCVGGTYTSLASATTAFVSDAVVEIRSLGSNQFDCYYNGTKRGLTQTISDAGIISNTRYGLFSTYSANQFSTGLTLGGVLIPFGF